MGTGPSTLPRTIPLTGEKAPGRFPGNEITNTKYNVFTFLPLVLYNQFKYFFNLYFLLIALSQFFAPLKVGFLFTYICPLTFVLTVNIIKEAREDLNRWQRDKEVNRQTYKCIQPGGSETWIQSQEIKVGHLIHVTRDERIPADMILLHSSEEYGQVYLRTDQLDGETDWKSREPIALTQKQYASAKNFLTDGIEIFAAAPSMQIYEFNGKVEAPILSEAQAVVYGNTMWAGTVLASHDAIGVVVYTGRDTRAVMNSRKASSKLGVWDVELNRLSQLLFVLMFLISLIILICRGLDSDSPIVLLRYILLLSSIIPISLRVNLDLAKLYYSYLIDHDPEIPGTQAKNTSIPEELGRVQMLMTDKTGTLTQNIMKFSKMMMGRHTYYHDTLEEYSQIVQENWRNSQGPMGDDLAISSKGAKRRHGYVQRDMISAIALCHNVTPIEEEGHTQLQGSSPDELALVTFASEMGFKLLSRRENYIQISNAADEIEEYDILQIFPFSSSKKRMGIIVKHRVTGRIIFYLKGANDIMEVLVDPRFKTDIHDHSEDLAREGLRTLVIAQREITPDQYQTWLKTYQQASVSLHNREELVAQEIAKLEMGLEYLGSTGVEDALQTNVRQTIVGIRESGIAVWMLTGDKMETAKWIAISTGMKSIGQNYYEIRNSQDAIELIGQLRYYGKLLKEARDEKAAPLLVIEGNTISNLLAIALEEFIIVSNRSPGVICCRVSPTQKTEIVEAMKISDKRICAIGDGGNDVGMIQAAHVGIGIVGKEGKQAALASDFSIVEFSVLQDLLLWHGRCSYNRTSKLSYFVFHRGLMISVIQAIFISLFYYAAIPIYNGWLMLGYSTIYTMLPVFSLVLDEDTDRGTVRKYPILYRTIAKGRMLNLTSFLKWLARGVYQGSVIILLGLILFSETSFTHIVSITFSSLVLTEWLNIGTEIVKWHRFMVIAVAASFICYLTTVIVMHEYFDLDVILSIIFAFKVLIVTIISCGPNYLIKWVVVKFFPSETEKLQRESIND